MSADPVSRFLDDVQRSGLLSTRELQAFTADFALDRPAGADDVAARFVERKLLTPYQAARLLDGAGAECLITATASRRSSARAAWVRCSAPTTR